MDSQHETESCLVVAHGRVVSGSNLTRKGGNEMYSLNVGGICIKAIVV